MPRGRKSRSVRFARLAENFAFHVKKGLVRVVQLNDRHIRVGKRNTRRVVEKREPDLSYARDQRNRIITYLSNHSLVPSHFVLVVPAEARGEKGVYQEFFGRPSVQSLRSYLQYKRSGPPRMWVPSKEEYLTAKRFANQPQNNAITLEQIDEAWKELLMYRDSAILERGIQKVNLPLQSHNVVCLGITRAGKLRLAIIDV